LPERRRRSRTRPATTETGATEWTDGTGGTDGTEATSRAEAAAHEVEEGVMTTFDGAGSDGEADVHDASAETHGDAPG